MIDPATNGDEVAAVDGEDAEVAEPAPETFSDLDDDEMDTFLLSKEERTLKEKVPDDASQQNVLTSAMLMCTSAVAWQVWDHIVLYCVLVPRCNAVGSMHRHLFPNSAFMCEAC